MTAIYAGCVLDRPPGPRLGASLPFFELSLRAPIPRLATLARYGKSRGKNAPKMAFVAPKSCWKTPQGPMRKGPELDKGLDFIMRAADAVGSFAIVLATASELSVGERDKSLAADVIERLKASGRIIVFAPRGLWEPEQAIPFVKSVGAVYGFDPLEHDVPPGDIAYARIQPMGARARLTEGHLATILDRLVGFTGDAYVSIEGEQGLAAAKRLTKAAVERAELEEELGDEEGDEEDADGDEDDVDENEEDAADDDDDIDDDEEEDIDDDEEEDTDDDEEDIDDDEDIDEDDELDDDSVDEDDEDDEDDEG